MKKIIFMMAFVCAAMVSCGQSTASKTDESVDTTEVVEQDSVMQVEGTTAEETATTTTDEVSK